MSFKTENFIIATLAAILSLLFFYSITKQARAPMIYMDGFTSNFDDRPDNEIREIDKNY